MLTAAQLRRHPRSAVSTPLRGNPDARRLVNADAAAMWHVTTSGDLPDDYEQREHHASASAWTTITAAS